jgi:hypothetical protein
MHWLSQPRGLDGRFQSSGGSNKPDPLNDWFLKAPWWQKILALTAMVAFMLLLYYSGYILVFIIVCWVLIWVMRLITAWLQG